VTGIRQGVCPSCKYVHVVVDTHAVDVFNHVLLYPLASGVDQNGLRVLSIIT